MIFQKGAYVPYCSDVNQNELEYRFIASQSFLILQQLLDLFYKLNNQINFQVFYLDCLKYIQRLLFRMRPINLYMDFLSQPSRAVLSLLLISKVPYNIIQTRVSKKQTKEQRFLVKNPRGTVPFIQDTQNGLKLSQSHAIMRYISRKYPEKVDYLYPQKDNYKLAKIDQYLDFHHTNTRKLFAKNVIVDPQFIQRQAKRNVDSVLQFINKQYFKNKGNEYLIGQHPTLADLSAYFQLQFLILDGQNFIKWPKIKSWIINMSKIRQIKEANDVFIRKLLPKINSKADMSLI